MVAMSGGALQKRNIRPESRLELTMVRQSDAKWAGVAYSGRAERDDGMVSGYIVGVYLGLVVCKV